MKCPDQERARFTKDAESTRVVKTKTSTIFTEAGGKCLYREDASANSQVGHADVVESLIRFCLHSFCK